MKINMSSKKVDRDAQIITRFGAARLVRRIDRRLELRGGSADDHSAAREWISLFMHEAVPIVRRESERGNPA
ncbi:MAG TPA: hypothetical protein VN887_09570 [Candidatus Angelobacter sp.]|nr:hypothetical protein [Candidatus Angelobacter sp.]